MAVMIDSREERLYGIKLRLGAYAANAYMEQGRLSESEESLMEGLLNIILDSNLKNMNLERENFPAIDLGDRRKGLAVQVTSTGTREKVRHTLKEFFDNGLNGQFSRLIIVVVGRAERFSTAPQVPDGFDFVPKRDIWDLAGLLREIRGLPERKLGRVDAYLRERVNLPQRDERLRLPLTTSLEDGRFVGREEDLDQIASRFEREHVVVLTGLGGMGKTELAIHFGRNHWFGRTYFVRFRNDWTETVIYGIADGIKDYKRENRPVEDIYADVMEVLEACGPDDLLILDNADQVGESFDQLWNALSGLDIRVLITTRDDVRGASKVVPMDNENLYGLFEQHGVKLSRENMDALITAVQGHTMTVDLMARLLRRERRSDSYQALIEALGRRDLDHTEFGAVAAAYPGAKHQARVNEHLKAVFRVSDMSEPEKGVLRFCALLSDSGLDSALFSSAAENALRPVERKRGFFARLFGKRTKPAEPAKPPRVSELLKDLADRGWLDWEGDLLRIHPVIRLVCIEELKPTAENCDPFLDWFRGQYGGTTYDREKFAQIAALYETASHVLGETDGLWANNAGYLWNVLVEPQRALNCNMRTVALREQNDPNSPNLATAYNNLGNTYGHLGDHEKALEYKLKDLVICEQVLPPTHPDLALSYNNVGSTYGDLGDHEKALEYNLKALAIREQVLPPTHPDLAQSYNNVGYAYGHLGDHEKALEYQLKDLAICEQVLPPIHPDLALYYNNVGLTYGDLGDHEKELKYQLKALAIREQVLPPTHPDLAQSYNNVGYAYGNQGDHEQELEYMLKAVAIREQILSPDHPDLATSYNNVGSTYGDLGDHEKALEYNLKALAIREQVLPPTHPDLAQSYNNVGYAYGNQGNHEKELEYQLKALAIREQVLPPTHPSLALSYNNVGSTYGDLGDHEKALDYQLKALAIWEQVLPPTHPDLALSYNNVGYAYGHLGDHEKALEYQLKDLAICEQVLPPIHPDLALYYNNVGLTYGDLGDHEKELKYQLKALAIREQVLPPTHPDLAQSYNNVGYAYGNQGDHEQELDYQLKALTIWEQVLPPTHPDLAGSYNNVGSTYGNLGDHEKELDYQHKALAIWEQSLPPDHPNNIVCRSNIAYTYAKREDFIRASEYMDRALDSAERSMKGHPKLEMYRWAAKKLAHCARCQERGEPFDNPFQ